MLNKNNFFFLALSMTVSISAFSADVETDLKEKNAITKKLTEKNAELTTKISNLDRVIKANNEVAKTGVAVTEAGKEPKRLQAARAFSREEASNLYLEATLKIEMKKDIDIKGVWARQQDGDKLRATTKLLDSRTFAYQELNGKETVKWDLPALRALFEKSAIATENARIAVVEQDKVLKDTKLDMVKNFNVYQNQKTALEAELKQNNIQIEKLKLEVQKLEKIKEVPMVMPKKDAPKEIPLIKDRSDSSGSEA